MNIKTLTLMATAALIAGSGNTRATVPSSRPNIVFIISDDQAWGDYGFMGHPQIATPHLDRLAARSLTFRRGYTPVPLCRPSLSSIVTGLYPHQHGVTGNDPALPDAATRPQAGRTNPKYDRFYQTIVSHFAKCPNLVRDLTAGGYVSFQTGKWWEGDPVKTAGFSQAMTAGTGKADRHGGKGLEIGREGLKPIQDFIGQAGDKPFLIWYAPMLPHTPHTPPADLLEKYLKLAPSEPVARYWACVEWFDRTCGELLDDLARRGLRDNTIIVYACDNGWLQNPDKANAFAPRSKLSPYEGGVRTPIMISWPAKLKPRMDTEHLATTLDLWPTLAALLDTKTPADLPGVNLADEQAVTRRQRIFGEQYAHNIADVDQPARSLENRWMIDGWWKLIAPDPRNRPDAGPELYDLKNDPWEKTDLSAAQPERVKSLSKEMDQWWQAEQPGN
jgi:arylsulfatase A-like enzyme